MGLLSVIKGWVSRLVSTVFYLMLEVCSMY